MRYIPILIAAFFLWLPCIAIAQNTGTLSGTVLDEDGKPVAGATVRIEGTTQGAISRVDGSFLVRGVRSGEYPIRVTCLGYGPHHDTIVIVAGSTWESVASLKPAKLNRSISRGCFRIGILDPRRMGTVHRVFAATLDNSPRSTLFGGSY
jgi:Carboxypeptidase regulatory-like domain